MLPGPRSRMLQAVSPESGPQQPDHLVVVGRPVAGVGKPKRVAVDHHGRVPAIADALTAGQSRTVGGSSRCTEHRTGEHGRDDRGRELSPGALTCIRTCHTWMYRHPGGAD